MTILYRLQCASRPCRSKSRHKSSSAQHPTATSAIIFKSGGLVTWISGISPGSMTVETPFTSLISTQKTSGTGLQATLHPLVLLTISDYITRHTLRQQNGPIVGALLGQQNGREITIEHAFDCLLVTEGEEVILNSGWFDVRLQQSRHYILDPSFKSFC